MCFFNHQWEPKAVNQMQKRHDFMGEIRADGWARDPNTVILYVCKKCGTSKTVQIAGWWTLEQLKAGK